MLLCLLPSFIGLAAASGTKAPSLVFYNNIATLTVGMVAMQRHTHKAGHNQALAITGLRARLVKR